LGMCYDPSSSAAQVANINIIFSKEAIPQNYEEAIATLEYTAEVLDSTFGTETAYAEPTATEFSGHAAYILETQSYSGETIVMNQAIVVIEVDGGNLTITYTYFTEDQLNAAIDSVGSISFSK